MDANVPLVWSEENTRRSKRRTGAAVLVMTILVYASFFWTDGFSWSFVWLLPVLLGGAAWAIRRSNREVVDEVRLMGDCLIVRDGTRTATVRTADVAAIEGFSGPMTGPRIGLHFNQSVAPFGKDIAFRPSRIDDLTSTEFAAFVTTLCARLPNAKRVDPGPHSTPTQRRLPQAVRDPLRVIVGCAMFALLVVSLLSPNPIAVAARKLQPLAIVLGGVGFLFLMPTSAEFNARRDAKILRKRARQ